MAKFDAKKADLNKDGQLSDYEKNRGEATAAAMPMAKGYKMQMGVKEIDSPGTFSSKQSKIMKMSPLLQTENENGMTEVGRNTTSTEKMVQGLLGEELKTTIDLASDPTTTTVMPESQGSYSDVFSTFEKVGDKFKNPITGALYGDVQEFIVDAKANPAKPKTIETPGETAQKKETEFKPYPFKDTYDPFEARQEGRNIKATQRKLKREKIREARAQAKIDGKKGKEKREAIKSAKAQAKLDQRKATKKGMQDIATSVSTQVEKGKNPAKTDSYQAKPNEEPVMPMKPMQFRKVAYSGRKPGKSGYKK